MRQSSYRIRLMVGTFLLIAQLLAGCVMVQPSPAAMDATATSVPTEEKDTEETDAEESDAEVSAAPEIAAATITATDAALVVPETIPAGWVEVSFENTGTLPAFLIMARLHDDATLEDFMGALMEMMSGNPGVVPPATFTGTPSANPGTQQTVLYSLQPGTHVLLNVLGDEPQIATFTVDGEIAAAGEYAPAADLNVSLLDFAFGLPAQLTAGEQTWRIENIGQQWHEMIFIPVPDGTTLEDAMGFLMAMEGEGEEEEGEMPEFGFVWGPMSSGELAWVNFDLAPGTYLVSCFIEDVASDEHAIHAELGMLQIVTVGAATE